MTLEVAKDYAGVSHINFDDQHLAGPYTDLTVGFNGHDLKLVAHSPEASNMLEVARQDRLPASQLLSRGRSFSHQTYNVSDATFKHLQEAQQTVWQTKALLPYGQGNMATSIFATGGENYTRLKYTRGFHSNELGSDREFWPALTQGGNCGEHAQLTFALLRRNPNLNNAPIGRCAEDGVDHAYTIIGDPRDPNWGDKNTIVVDAWPDLVGAHRLRDGRFNKPIVNTWGQAGEAATLGYQSLVDLQTRGSDTISARLHKKPGKALVYSLAESQHNSKGWVWQQWLAAQDPSTRYVCASNPQGSTFYQVPESYLDYKADASDQVQKYRFFDKNSDQHLFGWEDASEEEFTPAPSRAHRLLQDAPADTAPAMPTIPEESEEAEEPVATDETPISPEAEEPAAADETPTSPEAEEPAAADETPTSPEAEEPAAADETPTSPEVEEPVAADETPTSPEAGSEESPAETDGDDQTPLLTPSASSSWTQRLKKKINNALQAINDNVIKPIKNAFKSFKSLFKRG